MTSRPESSGSLRGHPALAMAPPGERIRGTFPSPHFAAAPLCQPRCGRRLVQRRHRKQAWVSWANEGIDALNSLSGFQSSAAGPPANGVQRESCAVLAAAYSIFSQAC